MKMSNCILIIFGLFFICGFADQVFSQSLSSEPSTRPNIVKFNATSVLFGTSILSYERSISRKISIESSIKFVGTGLNIGSLKTIQSGYAFDIGAKFWLLPFNGNELELIYNNENVLEGIYLKPGVGFNSFIERGFGKKFINIGSDLGTQFIINDRFCIDLYTGSYFLAGKFSAPKDRKYLIGRGTYESIEYTVSTGEFFSFYIIGISLGIRMGYRF